MSAVAYQYSCRSVVVTDGSCEESDGSCEESDTVRLVVVLERQNRLSSAPRHAEPSDRHHP